jgi:hypothetical protein
MACVERALLPAAFDLGFVAALDFVVPIAVPIARLETSLAVVQSDKSSGSSFPASSRRPAFSPAGRGISRKRTAVRAKLHHYHFVILYPPTPKPFSLYHAE